MTHPHPRRAPRIRTVLLLAYVLLTIFSPLWYFGLALGSPFTPAPMRGLVYQIPSLAPTRSRGRSAHGIPVTAYVNLPNAIAAWIVAANLGVLALAGAVYYFRLKAAPPSGDEHGPPADDGPD
jgi:hypothetical protein